MRTGQFRKLVEMGYGTDSARLLHPLLGEAIWQYSGQGIQLQFFKRGFVYTPTGDGSTQIEYSSVIRIVSTLTAQKMSAVAGSFTGQEVLSIIIETDRRIEIMVPLVIYSPILRALKEVVT